MKKEMILLLLLIVMSSCTNLPFVPSKQSITIPQTHQGTHGVDVYFLDNAPPFEVFENQLIDIGISVENKGAVDVQNGVYVFGVPEDVATNDVVYGRFGVSGKKLFNPFGDMKNIFKPITGNDYEKR